MSPASLLITLQTGEEEEEEEELCSTAPDTGRGGGTYFGKKLLVIVKNRNPEHVYICSLYNLGVCIYL